MQVSSEHYVMEDAKGLKLDRVILKSAFDQFSQGLLNMCLNGPLSDLAAKGHDYLTDPVQRTTKPTPGCNVHCNPTKKQGHMKELKLALAFTGRSYPDNLVGLDSWMDRGIQKPSSAHSELPT
jgi:hypothetical protein